MNDARTANNEIDWEKHDEGELEGSIISMTNKEYALWLRHEDELEAELKEKELKE